MAVDLIIEHKEYACRLKVVTVFMAFVSMANQMNSSGIQGWFTLSHKHKHKPTYAYAVRC